MNEEQKQALLDQLRSVRTPDVPVWPAPGWWLLIAAVLVGIALAFVLYRRHRSRLWQRQARAELHRIRASMPTSRPGETLAECSKLARRIMLASRCRQDVASLHGRSWLDALDELCQQPLFAGGFGSLLESAPYEREPNVNHKDLDALLDALDVLIRAAGRRRPSRLT